MPVEWSVLENLRLVRGRVCPHTDTKKFIFISRVHLFDHPRIFVSEFNTKQMRTTLLLLVSLMVQLAFGQKLYLDSLYKKVNMSTHKFGTLDDESLEFDFYRAEDAKGNLPLVVYVHGGGFSSGSRDSKGIQYFAKRLAQRGYAVASVSYRLTMKDIGFECEVTAEQKKEAFRNASHDVMMAVKHMLDYNSGTFQINDGKVVLVGSSAGAEAVLNLAYDFDYGEILNGFRFAGVIGMAGALTDLESISVASAIPTQLFHGTGDALIPYETGPHHYCGSKDSGYLMLYGSGPIARRLKGLGASYYLYTVNGGSHGWSAIPMNKCFSEIVDFLYNDIVYPKGARQTERTVTE